MVTNINKNDENNRQKGKPEFQVTIVPETKQEMP